MPRPFQRKRQGRDHATQRTSTRDFCGKVWSPIQDRDVRHVRDGSKLAIIADCAPHLSVPLGHALSSRMTCRTAAHPPQLRVEESFVQHVVGLNRLASVNRRNRRCVARSVVLHPVFALECQ